MYTASSTLQDAAQFLTTACALWLMPREACQISQPQSVFDSFHRPLCCRCRGVRAEPHSLRVDVERSVHPPSPKLARKPRQKGVEDRADRARVDKLRDHPAHLLAKLGVFLKAFERCAVLGGVLEGFPCTVGFVRWGFRVWALVFRV